MTMHWRQFQELQQVAEIGDRYISYVDRGQGRPLVLLHGIPTWGYLWHAVIPHLESGRRVIVPDLPGFGYSDRSDRFDRSISRQAEMIDAWMEKIGLAQADFAGHDIGGGVALRLACLYPNRVERLCLLNSVCYDSWPTEMMLQLGHPGMNRRFSARATTQLLRVTLRPGFQHPQPWLIAGLLQPYTTEVGKLSLIRDAAALDTNLTTELIPFLGRVRQPTLILWGAEDPFQPAAYGARLAIDIAHSDLGVVPEARHFLPIDQPGEIAERLLNFLGG